MPADRSTPKGRQESRRPQRSQTPARGSQAPSREARTPVRGAQPAARNRWYMFGGGAVVVALIAVVAVFQFAPRNGNSGTTPNGEPSPGAAINTVSCEAEMTQYHYHAALIMYMNGAKMTLPPQVGQPYNKQINMPGNTCLYWMHTHSYDSGYGIVHLESPIQRTFTVGEFFDIWRYTAKWDMESDQSYKSYVDPTFVTALLKAKPSEIHAYVNGKPYSGDYKQIVLHAHDAITIELGKPQRPAPKKGVFPYGE
jgi:hypothetical protein